MADTNEFRHLLRKLRTERGMSQDAVGAEVHVTGSQIGHYESGRSVPVDDMAARLDDVLGADGELRKAAEQSRGEVVAPWLRPWADNEERAITLRLWEHSIVPGLLQTEAYARAVFGTGWHTPNQAEEALRTRLERQAAALDRPDPVTLAAIIGESVLHQGAPGVMKEQLTHLLDIGHRPNVHLRVVPTSAGIHAGVAGAFAIATLADGSTVVYLDDLVEGKIGSRARDLRRAVTAWESVCAKALPSGQSRQLIMKAIDHHGTELAYE
ncbi:helix-turn-helix transcriptional regulator [Plantactinospora mayteni]|uniref:Transcriptional regulator n=1 Tax=Plantactinospora mayteni TaxID=566021 RepID=A0ABQ4ENR7_9ACTN|nr:helix-turn-helix transcriptional regulator [Plantactinospora mayteni]GIG96303.1 transcriptional regulator [Plantactinospora mayteni]